MMIIGLSFLNDQMTTAAMARCGVSAYLSKEQAVTHLLKAIHSLIGHSALRADGQTPGRCEELPFFSAPRQTT